jgi:DNA invertase Pin-like site-specific DNA recombinase
MEVQRQEIIDFCKKSGLTIEKEFLEYASDNGAFKPEFERLKAAVGNREFDKIVITELSKINRNLNNFIEFNELLSLNNVELIGTRLEKICEFKILHGRRSLNGRS